MIKLSQRDNQELKIGDKFEYTDKNSFSWEQGDILEVIEIMGDSCKIKNLRSNNYDTYSIDNWLGACEGAYKCLKRVIVHEYSPVNMTGYYKTIGD